jgi:hypothetical protein
VTEKLSQIFRVIDEGVNGIKVRSDADIERKIRQLTNEQAKLEMAAAELEKGIGGKDGGFYTQLGGENHGKRMKSGARKRYEAARDAAILNQIELDAARKSRGGFAKQAAAAAAAKDEKDKQDAITLKAEQAAHERVENEKKSKAEEEEAYKEFLREKGRLEQYDQDVIEKNDKAWKDTQEQQLKDWEKYQNEQSRIAERKFGELKRHTDSFAEDFTRALTSSADDSESAFDRIKTAFVQMLVDMTTQTLITNPLQDFLGGALGGITGNKPDAGAGAAAQVGSKLFTKETGGKIWDAAKGVGSWFGSFFADGGRPPRGRASIVGERGPEVFVPDGSGTIVPHGVMGGGGMQPRVNVNVINQNGTTSSVKRGKGGSVEILTDQLEGKLVDRTRRGGKLAQAMSQHTGTKRPPIEGKL